VHQLRELLDKESSALNGVLAHLTKEKRRLPNSLETLVTAAKDIKEYAMR
jgi:hypothetical protein